MKLHHKMKLRLILGLITFQGFLSASILTTSFDILSSHSFSFFLRIALYLITYLPVIFFSSALMLTVLYPSTAEHANQLLKNLSRKTTFLIGILIITLNGLTATFLYIFPSGIYLKKNSPLLDIFQIISLPTIIYILISIELLIYLLVVNKPDWRKFAAEQQSRTLGLFFLILFFTFLYWELLLLQTRKFHYLPHWLSPMSTRPITIDLFFILPFSLLILFVLKKTHLNKSWSAPKKLLLLVFFGLVSQYLFGFLSGEGLQSVQRFYYEQPISTSSLYGCQHSNIVDLIRNYDQYRGQDFFTKTKPPGFLTLHVLFAKFVKVITGVRDIQACKILYSQFGSFVFPMISALTILPITYISKKIFKLKSPYLPGILYCLTPNYLLWVMVPDQVLFPLLFLINILLFQKTIQQKSFGVAFFSGLVFYLSIFITFSVLPVIGILILWLAFEYLDQRIHKNQQAFYPILIGFILGAGLFYFLFLFGLDYDAISRYKLAFSGHRGIKDYSMNLRTIMTSSVINSLEFFTWTGIPLFFFFADYFFTSIKQLFSAAFKERYILTFSTAGIFIALNILGQTIGEVQRLWIFLVPLLAMITAADLEKLSIEKNLKKVSGLLFLQLTTAVLHYYLLRNEWP
jgi:hypothetical protein